MRTLIKVLALIGAAQALATKQDALDEAEMTANDLMDGDTPPEDSPPDDSPPEDSPPEDVQDDAPEDVQDDAPEDVQDDAPADEPQEEPEVSLPELTWDGSACVAEDGSAHT